MNEERRGNGVSVWAILLIVAGLVFLLNNLGILPWSAWGALWRFWPVLFIIWGLQIIFGRSRFSRLIVGIISLLIIGFLLLIVLSANNSQINDWVRRYFPNWESSRMLQQGDAQESTITVEDTKYSNITRRAVKAEVGIGKLVVEDSADTNFATLSSRFNSNFGVPKLNDKADGQELELDLTQTGKFMHWLSGLSELRYNLTLGKPELLTDTNIEIGTGSAEVVFDVLKVGQTTVEVGTGSAEVEFGAASVPTGEIKLEVGTGSIKIRVPKEVGLSIDHQVGLGSFEIDGNKLKGDGEYKTSNYDSSTVKATVRGEIGTGSITVERY